jgi:hypothetical protein
LRLSDTPDFGWFSKARAATHITAALAENLPHRSREHEFSAGRVGIFFENKSHSRCEAGFFNDII